MYHEVQYQTKTSKKVCYKND